jgi:hypothetical protein
MVWFWPFSDFFEKALTIMNHDMNNIIKMWHLFNLNKRNPFIFLNAICGESLADFTFSFQGMGVIKNIFVISVFCSTFN